MRNHSAFTGWYEFGGNFQNPVWFYEREFCSHIDEYDALYYPAFYREEDCEGHEWVYTGTAYGGDDESYHGEGRCYCIRCGADGDG